MAVENEQTDHLAPVELTLEVPGRLVRDYGALVTAGVYMSLEEALRATLVTGWRYDRGTYHSVRLDIGKDNEDEGSGEQPAAHTPAEDAVGPAEA